MYLYSVYMLCIFVSVYMCVCMFLNLGITNRRFLTLESPIDANYHSVKINHCFLHPQKRNKDNVLVPHTVCSRHVSICCDPVKNDCSFI